MAVPSALCWPTSCSTTWIRSLRNGATGSYGTQTTATSMSEAGGPRAGNGRNAKFIENRLKLKVNEARVLDPVRKTASSRDSVTGEKEPRIRIAPKALERFKNTVRRLTDRGRSTSTEERIRRPSEYPGVGRLLQAGPNPCRFPETDRWIRRRLRMCIPKQWKNIRTKRRKLVSLGSSHDDAMKIAFSRKGYWRLAETPQLHIAMGNRYFKTLGLVSLASGVTLVNLREPPYTERPVGEDGARRPLLLDSLSLKGLYPGFFMPSAFRMTGNKAPQDSVFFHLQRSFPLEVQLRASKWMRWSSRASP